ncbi:MAG: hypothetical protein RIT44_97 [Pseudomonadota bacterium]|jgi:hypothetical protein
MAQKMPRGQLVLMGASAGWMLPTGWLQQFDEIHAWDIDPLAAPLFKWRHARDLQRQGTALQFHTGDGLAQLAELVQRMPQAFYWFDNVLGQLRFIEAPHSPSELQPKPQPQHHSRRDPTDATHQRLEALQKTLATVSWGSVHDRMSGPTRAHTASPPAHGTHAGLAMETPEAQAWLQKIGAISPWLDHLTEHVLPPGTPVQYTAWPFKSGYAHWLEMGWTRPISSTRASL